MEITLRREERRRAYTVEYTWKMFIVSVVLLRMIYSTEMEIEDEDEDVEVYLKNSMRGSQHNGMGYSDQRNLMSTQHNRRESDRKRQSQSACEVLAKKARLHREEGPQGYNALDYDNIIRDKHIIAQTFLNYLDVKLYVSNITHTLDEQSFYEKIKYNQEEESFSIDLTEYNIITNSKNHLPSNNEKYNLEGLLGRIRIISCNCMRISSNIPSNMVRLLVGRAVVKDYIHIDNLNLVDIDLDPFRLIQNANPQPNASKDTLDASIFNSMQITIENCSTATAIAILSWISIRWVEKLAISNCQLFHFDLKGIRFATQIWIGIYQDGAPSYSIAFQEIHEEQQVLLHLFGSSKLKEITSEKGATIPLYLLFIVQEVFTDFVESYKEAAFNSNLTRKDLLIKRLEIGNSTQTYKEIKGLCNRSFQVENIYPIPNYFIR
ncbi:hypothetical protein NEFER03_2235 [Nematocida sp. LUAm3]|nr:hypothetical protein NEFER03_2235 [Nematocida sp. LUAm3]KAI5176462.1 hypothetical protein NEFER02_2214 [Nematocida sp. LUAm2]KAI5179335.1 hypothetical protein NEFER01_2178 [Nematocida sp. LUAm1]